MRETGEEQNLYLLFWLCFCKFVMNGGGPGSFESKNYRLIQIPVTVPTYIASLYPASKICSRRVQDLM
jgi:hypothetical protein